MRRFLVLGYYPSHLYQAGSFHIRMQINHEKSCIGRLGTNVKDIPQNEIFPSVKGPGKNGRIGKCEIFSKSICSQSESRVVIAQFRMI